ncbi:MAG: DUF2589 domain-containing protein [Bacteroidales bacterium]|nr:DUF2589 domain-containing protein [Bacteroidales bacterium]
MNNNPFQIKPQNLSRVDDEMSQVPFGSLIGNILTACVNAQENASNVAWDYTQTVLSRKTPVVFTFMEGKTLKRLEVPLVTIVPLPYLRIDDIAIAFDARVEVENTASKQFVVQINNENSEETTMQKAKATANMHIDIDAGATDMPVGLASLLDIMSGGFIVEDVVKPKPMLPHSDPRRPSSSSGHRPINLIIQDFEHNSGNLAYKSSQPTSGSGKSSSLDEVIEIIDANRVPPKPNLKPGSSSGKGSVEQVIASMPDSVVANSTSKADATSKKEKKEKAQPVIEEEPVKETVEKTVMDEAEAEHFSDEIDAKMKESSAKNQAKPKPAPTVAKPVVTSGSGYHANLTFHDNIAAEQQPYGGNPVLALHVNWTKPSRVREPGRQYYIEDFDLLSTILSALLWRRFNGPIKLYTDNVGYAYYSNLGMLDLWDGGVDVDVLEAIPNNVPADIFWAGAKLFAIREQTVPFLMMDTDLMVWSDIRERLKGYNVMAYHPESLTETTCYIDYKSLKKPKGYKLNSKWDWTIDPYNTALTYFADEKFLKYYTDSAIEFMRGNTERPSELVSQMVFAEQRLFAMCAKFKDINVGTFLSSPFEDSPDFTHIWGGKDEARNNSVAGNRLCATIARTIAGNFKDTAFSPQVSALLKKYNKK